MKMYFQSKYITDRPPYDVNAPESGALNANFTDAEAAIYVSNQLGISGFTYEEDFYFINCGAGVVVLEFYNESAAATAAILFADAVTPSSKGFKEI